MFIINILEIIWIMFLLAEYKPISHFYHHYLVRSHNQIILQKFLKASRSQEID